MELKHIKGIGPAKETKFREAGIDTVEQLARCNPAEVAGKVGMSIESVSEYRQKAVALALLEDLKGIGPKTIGTLAEAGVANLKDLYSASSERLAAEMKVAQERVREWQEQARVLAARVAEDAKTPEGRQKLANEARELAQKTANRAEELGRAAMERAEQGREYVAKKAEELRARVPEMQDRVKDAAHKTEAFVRSEAQKAKATSEAAVDRVKQKWTPPQA